jgi:hypothetical protein
MPIDLNTLDYDLGIYVPDGYVDKATTVSDDCIVISKTRYLRVIDVLFVKGYVLVPQTQASETGEQSAPKKGTKKGKGRDVEEKDTPVPGHANQQPAKKATTKQAKGRAVEEEGTPVPTQKSALPRSKSAVVEATPAITPPERAASQPVKPKPKPRPIPIKKAHRQKSPPAFDDEIEILDEAPKAAASSPDGACISLISFRFSADCSMHSFSYSRYACCVPCSSQGSCCASYFTCC